MKNNKILIVASVASMIDQFNISNIKILQELGMEVHVACNFITPGNISIKRNEKLKQYLNNNNVKYYHIDFNRNPFNVKGLLQSYYQLKNIMKNNYIAVHSHSPIGGALSRITARKYRKKGLKSIYTAHGFHFHKNSSFINWIIYYPIEFFLSKITDFLITINNEDYSIAIKKFHNPEVFLIPGMGIDFSKFKILTYYEKEDIKYKFGIKNVDYILTSVGELNKNKNHETAIKALHTLVQENPHKNFLYIICGKGQLINELKKLIVDLNLLNNVFILGYIENINEILNISDIFIFPSYREGLGMACLEAMAVGLPIVTSDVHGINDYSHDGISGFKCKPNDIDCFSKSIKEILFNTNLSNRIKINNLNTAKEFDQEIVKENMLNFYKIVLSKK